MTSTVASNESYGQNKGRPNVRIVSSMKPAAGPNMVDLDLWRGMRFLRRLGSFGIAAPRIRRRLCLFKEVADQCHALPGRFPDHSMGKARQDHELSIGNQLRQDFGIARRDQYIAIASHDQGRRVYGRKLL